MPTQRPAAASSIAPPLPKSGLPCPKERQSKRRPPEGGRLLLTAAASGFTLVRTDRLTVWSEAGLGFRAPEPRRVVRVVDVLFIGIRYSPDVHPFVAESDAVNARRELGRDEMVHGYARNCTGLSPAICRIARLTAVLVICTL